jgi:ABC-type transport system substrate-binding protein
MTTRSGGRSRRIGRTPSTTAVAAALLVAALALAHAQDAPPSDELHVGVARVPARLDPAAARDPAELMAVRLVYQGLVAFGERGEVEPALAASWGVSRDGLVWTFRLRPDVRLHDGTSLRVDDVVAALGARVSAVEPDESAPAWVRPFQGAARVVREIRPGDPGTVQVVLTQPYAPLLALLAHPAWTVAVARGEGEPVGSGPYRAAELGPSRLVLEAVPGGGEPPATRRLVLHAMADDTAALAALGPSGPLHAAFLSSPPAWAALGLQVVSATTWRVGLIALRTDRGLTSRKTIRQAVALALDPGLVRPALGRWAVPLTGWLPPGAWGAREAPLLAAEPARARRLLGQVAPLDPTLTLLVGDQTTGPEPAGLADAVRLSLSAAGFRVQVRVEAPDVAREAVRQGEADLALVERALDVNDPDFYLRPLLSAEAAAPGSATNAAFLQSPLVDGMLVRAGQLGFRPERLRLYHRLQTLLAEELPYIPLYARLQWLVARPEVRGARLHPAGFHRLEAIRREPPVPAAPAAPAGSDPPLRP